MAGYLGNAKQLEAVGLDTKATKSALSHSDFDWFDVMGYVNNIVYYTYLPLASKQASLNYHALDDNDNYDS
ncbi:unnamed protein product [Linum trigynum]|uniref:Uncharacterized protein n=1 Tax=Linum trigynum TaxID=586398 RepID=A0AAV2C798_9ROSI